MTGSDRSGGNGKHVNICGSWDAWKKKIPLVKSHDDFITIINLPEGRHEFKFHVDGTWICDNNLPKTENTMGTENNVIIIDRADFEVFDALEKDLAAANSSGRMKSPSFSSGCEKSLSFCQDIPSLILNQDTSMSCDPNLLPEPNHVMLNHLYALSIKDGVMVLSATHRYRKKYVTTLLYKPI
ncbi:unnamed protein product [Soboliphyme baturini]|uniref:5'-AMP-activated protein kinase subunit beta-1 n=1 Tax=Soboliphyme baturini TaxID=241478 RepID=A0A183IR71_9BILA|nr:unnamed protein product [Soboliphyme baturini]